MIQANNYFVTQFHKNSQVCRHFRRGIRNFHSIHVTNWSWNEHKMVSGVNYEIFKVMFMWWMDRSIDPSIYRIDQMCDN